MRRYVFLMCIIYALSLLCMDINVVSADTSGYAQIVSEVCYLYRNPTSNPDIDNIWCEIEKSYFVEILNDYNDDFFKVNYNSVVGFVAKDDVKEVVSAPISPFPSNINVNINSTSGCYMRSSPISKTTTNNIIHTLDKGTSNILFIGYSYGDECVDLKGNLWYLVKYNNDIGYIYSDFVEKKITLYPNVEEVSYIIKDMSSTMLNPLSDTSTLIVVVLILIPCIFILILLFIPKPKMKSIKLAKKPIKEIDLTEVSDIYNDIDL